MTSRPPLARVLAACVVAVVLGLAPLPAASGATWSAPGYVRSIGSRGVPGVYGWGIQYNPVTDEIVVGDYLNYAVRRYSPDGVEQGWFWRSPSERNGHPESVAVDPRDGSVYASDRSAAGDRGVIVKFDAAGNFLWEVQTTATYNAWLTVDDAGYLYVADSHFWHDETDPPKVRKYLVDDAAHSATEVASVGTWGEGPGQVRWITGIDVDSAGRLYASDPINRTVHVWDWSDPGNPVWVRDIGSSGGALGQFTGDLRGVVVDESSGWVYVVDAEGGEIEKFALDGTPLLHWGSEGNAEGQFADGGRQITLDAEGDVWVADYGNFRFMEFDPSGGLLNTFPDPAQPPPQGGLGQPRDVAVDPTSGEVWVAETNNQRFQRFAADGSPLGTWGLRNSEAPWGMNYPRGIGFDPVTGMLWLANSSQDQLNVYDPDSSGVTPVATYGEMPRGYEPGHFLKPMDIEFDGDRVYVGAYNAPNLKVLEAATGTELFQIAQRHSGVAVDPATHDVYLVSWGTDKVYRYSSEGVLLGSFGSRSSGPGQFDNPWDATFCNGVLYVTDTKLNRVQAFDAGGTYLGTWGSRGTKPGQFANPSGIDHDASCNIYVADTTSDRVQVFSPSLAAPSGDTVVPAATFTSPLDGATVEAGTVVLTGSTTDSVRTGTVEVALRNTETNRFWDARFSTWSTKKTWNLAGMTGTDLTSMSWFYPFVGAVTGGSYRAEVRATDAAGNRTTTFPAVTVSVPDGGPPPDTTPPDATVTVPTSGQSFSGAPVELSGTATDDRGLGAVRIAVQDRTTKLWARSDSTWGSYQLNDALLNEPGGAETDWSASWTPPPGGSGSYGLQVQAVDSSGNADPTKPWVNFSITS